MTRQKNNAEREGQPIAIPRGDRVRGFLLCGMMALLVARPLYPSESAASQGDGLTAVMLWIALAAAWLLAAAGKPKFHVRLGCIDAAVLGLIGWHSAAALWAVAHASAWPAWNMLWEWVGMGLCYFLARQLIETPRERRAVAAVMIALAVALAGYGLYQYAYEMPNTRAEYAADPDGMLRRAELWFPPGSPERVQFENRLKSVEPMSTFALTNSLAGYLAPWLVVLACMGFGLGALRGRRRLLAGFCLCGLTIAACLVLTKSRSAYAATALGFALAWLSCRRRSQPRNWKTPAMLLGAVVVLIALGAAVGGLDREVLGEASKSLGYRLQYWQSSLRMIADHPVVGCGPGNFQDAYLGYKLPEASEEVADPHNFALEIAATAGLPALFLFLLVLGCWSAALLPSPFGRGARGEGGEIAKPPPLTPTISRRERGPMQASDSCLFILLGGVFGFPLSFVLGLFSAATPGAAAVLLGLPLAVGAVWWIYGWIVEGQWPRWAAPVGFVVLLVNLSAAGGIGMPGVAGTFWILLALGVPNQPAKAFRSGAGWAGLVAALGLAVACYATAYRPVLNCQAQMQMAIRDLSRAREHLQSAAEADPWSAEPWRRLAALEFDAWMQNPGKEGWRQFERANDELLRRSAGAASAWLASGNWHLQAFQKTRQKELVDRAVSDLLRAVRLYPNSALHRAQLAEALWAADRRAEFRVEAETALRLDAATPHRDRKLPDSRRASLLERLRVPNHAARPALDAPNKPTI